MFKKIFKKREGEEKVKWGWAMYDWANNVYSLVITTAIFPVFYNNLKANEWKTELWNFETLKLSTFGISMS